MKKPVFLQLLNEIFSMTKNLKSLCLHVIAISTNINETDCSHEQIKYMKGTMFPWQTD